MKIPKNPNYVDLQDPEEHGFWLKELSPWSIPQIQMAITYKNSHDFQIVKQTLVKLFSNNQNQSRASALSLKLRADKLSKDDQDFEY